MSPSRLIDAGSFTADQATRHGSDPAGAGFPLSGQNEVVPAVEHAALPRSWWMVLRIGLSVSATAALMWALGVKLVLGSMLLFWAALCAAGLVVWLRKSRNTEPTPPLPAEITVMAVPRIAGLHIVR